MILKLDLSLFISNEKKYALIHIDPESLKTVLDTINYICETFQINYEEEYTMRPEMFLIHNGMWYIPPNQSSCIFENIEGIFRLCFAGCEIEEPSTSSNNMHPKCDSELSINYQKRLVGESDQDEVVSNSNFNQSPNEEPSKGDDGSKNECLKQSKTSLNETDEEITNSSYKYEPYIKSSFPNETEQANRSINKSENDKISFETSFEPLVHFSAILNKMKSDDTKLRKPCESAVSKNKNYPNPKDMDEDSKVTNSNNEEITFQEAMDEQYTFVTTFNADLSRCKQETTNVEINELSTFAERNGELHDQKIKENSFEANDLCSQNDVQSVCDVSFKRKKRHRKHNQKKKHKYLENEMSKNKIGTPYKPSYVPMKHISRDEPINRVHKIFDDSDDEMRSDSTFLEKADKVNVKPSVNDNADYDDQFCSSSRKLSPRKLDVDHYDTKSQSCNKDSNSIKSLPKDLSKVEKLILKDLACSPYEDKPVNPSVAVLLDPPISNCNNEEISSEIKLKFKKLLALESRHEPYIFNKSKNMNGITQAYGDYELFDSLPFSFASRKHKNINTNPRYKSTKKVDTDTKWHKSPSMRDSPANPHTVTQQITSAIIDIVSDAASRSPPKSDLNLNDESFTGYKPKKNNQRYYQSIGNVLKSLTNKQNPDNDKVMEPDKNETSSNVDLISDDSTLPILKSELQTASPGKVSQYDLFQSSRDKLKDAKECSEAYENWLGTRSNNSVNLTEEREANSVALKDALEVGTLHGNNNSSKLEEAISQNKILPSPSSQDKFKGPVSNENSKDISYESFPILPSLPRIGEIIAAKVLDIDANMRPCYSDYLPARVLSVDGVNVKLQFLEKGLNGSTRNAEKCGSDSTISVMDWRDLKFPRLVYP